MISPDPPADCSPPDSAAAEYKLSRPEVAAWKLPDPDEVPDDVLDGVPASAAAADAAAGHCCADFAPRTAALALR
ncbi:MAG: hypothetical protein ACHQLQ_14880 [Candidatus Acidiferrales bacterium]